MNPNISSSTASQRCVRFNCATTVMAASLENKTHKSASKLVYTMSPADVPVRLYSQPTATLQSSGFLSCFLSKKPQAIMCVHQQVLKAFDRNNRANPQRHTRIRRTQCGWKVEKLFHCHPGFSLSSNILMKTNFPCPFLLMGQVLFLSLM